MADYQPEEGVIPTNSQVYRVYIERYLCSLPVVNQDLDLIISQKEATEYGVPIQVYFFSRNKIWKEYERIQSDILRPSGSQWFRSLNSKYINIQIKRSAYGSLYTE